MYDIYKIKEVTWIRGRDHMVVGFITSYAITDLFTPIDTKE
jgi:hypothetical protein